jgi:uncharacterized membrane protein YsdA (DUF1294 family)
MDWRPYLLWLAIAGVITFATYAFDKAHARTGDRRVPEAVLHWLALSGGFAGGWMGRAVFRHKTRKGAFAFILTISTAIHIGLAYWLFR